MTSEASSAPPDPSPSPRSTSLAAAATINAGTQAQEGRHTSGSFGRTDARGSASPTLRHSGPTRERRRSNVAMNISLNDPALPAPGELQTIGDNRPPSRTFRAASPQTISRSPSMADPHHHHRTPSIGELHQELEQEQEAQVVSSHSDVSITPRTSFFAYYLTKEPSSPNHPPTTISNSRFASSSRYSSHHSYRHGGLPSFRAFFLIQR